MKRRAHRNLYRLAGALALTSIAAGAAWATSMQTTRAASVAQKPNVIVILADDLGYGDTEVYGSKIIKTPNIDALAASGVRFTAGYVTNPVCAPSRAALMTGRYQQRFGYEFNPVGRDKTGGMSLNETTMAQIMKSAGYATGAIGKWHLGEPSGYYPSDRGFDSFFGMAGGGSDYIIDPAAGDEFIGLRGQDLTIPASGLSGLPDGEGPRIKALLEHIRDRAPITKNHQLVRVDGYLTEAFTNESLDFIDRNRDRPFFLYLAQHNPHAPLMAPKKYIDRYRNVTDPGKRVYAAMVSALDDSVGAVIAKLKEDGLYENTLVIFLSDNGCAGYIHGACSNAPLSGYKRAQLEGGIRIPFIISWPGHVPAGQIDRRQVSSLDILPTAAALAGAALPGDRAYDGVNLIPYLTGQNSAVPNPKLYWRDGPDFAMRDTNLKLLVMSVAPAGSRAGAVPGPNLSEPRVGPEGSHVMLFDLDRDIGEKHNLASIDTIDVSRMQSEIATWNKTLVKPMWPESKHYDIDYDGQVLELFY